jgi:hypothetical protein
LPNSLRQRHLGQKGADLFDEAALSHCQIEHATNLLARQTHATGTFGGTKHGGDQEGYDRTAVAIRDAALAHDAEAILGLEMARVREKELNARMNSM